MFDFRIHAYLRANAGPRAHRVGPFLASFDEHDAGPYRNYAIPDDGAVPTAADVELLVGAFVARSRKPRLEYLPGAAPRVEAALLDAGFAVEARLPIMMCPEAVAPPVDVELRLARSDADLRAVAEVQNAAYGAPAATEHDVARLRATVEGGGLVAGAFDGAACVGGGLVTPPHDGVGELAAIGVSESHRRRGIAGALTAFLTLACADAGITAPFLMPTNDAAERVYTRVGYRRVSEILHISR
ncbi:GNAT family N-acetyltransferase [Actinomadura kijaniata]|uniref:GNAT family N-acetyltransferase n=1 Tax=Actinomadura kijaniata TaxID=46161 RepID=UPI003F1B9600